MSDPQPPLREQPSEFSLPVLAAALLRFRRMLVGVPLALAFLTGVTVLLLPKKYTTRFSFTSAGAGAFPSQLAGLAAQFNVSLPGQESSQSPEFYAELVARPEALIDLVKTPFLVELPTGDSARQSFIELYEIDKGDEGKTVSEAVKLLNEKVLSTDPNRTTGVLSVTVRTKWPEVSTQIAERILSQVEDYNRASRQSQAAADSAFVASRLMIAERDLRTSENALEGFLLRNREYRQDPRLQFEFERLQRDIALKQGVYQTLAQGLEQSRLEAARNTPSIVLVERPLEALRFDRRQTLTKVVVATLLGVLVVVALAVFSQLTRENAATHSTDLASLRSEWDSARADFRKLISRVSPRRQS